MTFEPRAIAELADDLDIPSAAVIPYGRAKAKVDPEAIPARATRDSHLVLVTAINPTPAGEGKTTTSIGLAMGMRRFGKRVALCLREPSLGPVFGVKGGGTGGGKASLHPADDINLHFTGDLHAITSANNLLSAMIDNSLHFAESIGDKGRLDARSVTWARALDMNDRALRSVVLGLGGKSDGVPRQDRFDITAASEVMAILALAKDQADLELRLGRIVVGASEGGEPITAADLGASRAMAALLRDALLPNLVQTLEGGPALVHAGPFANIAHGCNSVVATQLGLRLGDYVVTEAGFGFDLGGEKFLDIKCRELGIWPTVVVMVATLRALKMHGGAPVKEAKHENAAALTAGMKHLSHHLTTLKELGLRAVVAINRFPDDADAEVALVAAEAAKLGAECVLSTAFSEGGPGGLKLAEAVTRACDEVGKPPAPRFSYELEDPISTKVEKIARRFYGARGVIFTAKAEKDRARLEKMGAGKLPVCIAKTQLSLTDQPNRPGRPEGFDITVRELRLAAGAGFVVALTGEMMTMPGLPREPAARGVHVDATGRIRGLMQND